MTDLLKNDLCIASMRNAKMVRLTRVLVSLLILALVGAAGLADAQDLRDGVVKISSTSRGGKLRTGTGFIVKLDADRAVILTAAHVVAGDKKPTIEFFKSVDPIPGEVLRSDKTLDVALVVVRGSVPRGLRALSVAPDESAGFGQDVATIGFPPGLSWALTKLTIASEEGIELALSGGNIDEGNSGGPLLKGDVVVGIVKSAERGSGRALPAQYLARLLKNWRIDIGTAPKQADVTTRPPLTAPRQQAVQPALAAPARSPGETSTDRTPARQNVDLPKPDVAMQGEAFCLNLWAASKMVAKPEGTIEYKEKRQGHAGGVEFDLDSTLLPGVVSTLQEGSSGKHRDLNTILAQGPSNIDLSSLRIKAEKAIEDCMYNKDARKHIGKTMILRDGLRREDTYSRSKWVLEQSGKFGFRSKPHANIWLEISGSKLQLRIWAIDD